MMMNVVAHLGLSCSDHPSMPKFPFISSTYNEVGKVPAAIESVRWCDEIILFELNRRDSTQFIAETLRKKVVKVKRTTSDALHNKVISTCLHEWIFNP